MAKIQRGHHFMSGFGNEDYLEDFFSNRTFKGRPAANFSEDDNMYRIEIGIPGLCRDDVQMQVSGNELRVQADGEADADRDVPAYSRQEFDQFTFNRAFKLPDDSDVDRISAHCKDGLLVIDIPKSEVSQKSRTIQID